MDALVTRGQALDQIALLARERLRAPAKKEPGARDEARPFGILLSQPPPIGPAQRVEGLPGQHGDVERVGADRRRGRHGADDLRPGPVQVDRDRLDLARPLGPRSQTKAARVALERPGRAQTIRPVSWQTTHGR